MASDTDTPIKVVCDGAFSVSYTNTKGESSAFRCTPDVGALFAAAPDLHRVVTFMLDHMNTKGVMVPWSHTRMGDGENETIWNAMHNAIAKAKPEPIKDGTT